MKTAPLHLSEAHTGCRGAFSLTEEVLAKQDPHAGESTSEVAKELHQLLANAKQQRDLWGKEVNRLEEELLGAIGDAYAATVDGVKVWTHRPEDRYAVRALMEQYPDLAEHYVETRVTRELNMERFKAAHPDVAAKFQVRSLRAYRGPGQQ